MRELDQMYYATNREIRDLLLSAKQRITEGVLHELMRDRGIFCSPHEERETLVERISMLIHDYSDVCGIIERRESSKRSEKTSTVSIDVSVTPAELKEIVDEYQKEEVLERVRHHQRGANGFVMNVEYFEFDYSKTRLLQRQDRDAKIEFISKDGRTELRLPATEKARAIVQNLKSRIEAKKKKEVRVNEIELTGLSSPEDRTAFFTRLISQLPQFPLENVSRLRVAYAGRDQENGVDLEEDEIEEAAEKMLGVVENVALTGENLVASEMYQELKEKGFFITSITWRARQSVDPYSMIEFDAGFEDRQAAKGFRYSVRGALRLKHGTYTKNLRHVEDAEKETLLTMIEETSRKVLGQLLAEASPHVAGEEGQ